MCKKYFILLVFFSLIRPTIKKNHLSNDWFSHNQKKLLLTLKNLNQQAHKQYGATIIKNNVRSAIVPHAGIEFSGVIAASVYRNCNPTCKKIFIIGPDHSGSVQGAALPSFKGFNTPIGTLATEKKIINSLSLHPSFTINDEPFNSEHSVQMQLPFIKYFFKDACVIPLIVGSITCTQALQLATELKKYIDQDSLVIISSDFVHYGPRFDYQPFNHHIPLQIRKLDSQAISLIEEKKCIPFEQFIATTGATICGKSAIKILLELLTINAFGAVEPRLISYDTSARFDDDKNSVSYVGMLFTSEKLDSLPADQRLTNYEKNGLLTQARNLLNNMFSPDFEPSLYRPITSFGLQQKAGVFTTIEKLDGTLRGCIGHITTQDPLYKTVEQTTLAAALQDTRFTPVAQNEIKNLKLKLSILSPPTTIPNYHAIRLGKDGVILNAQGKSAVFLPEVSTEFNWSLEQMLTELAKKAELSDDAWKDKDTQFKTFTTYEITE